MSLLNGDDNNVWGKAIKRVHLEVQGHILHFDFYVIHMTRADAILGHEWLHGLVPPLKHNYLHNTLNFDAHGAHILLTGEQDVLNSPLIYNAELHGIINNNEINNLSLFYFMYPCLRSIVCVCV